MTGARPDQINITFSPRESNCRRLPARKHSPKPTSSSREPTPHAIPNMVRNERSLWAQRVRKVCPKISKIRRKVGALIIRNVRVGYSRLWIAEAVLLAQSSRRKAAEGAALGPDFLSDLCETSAFSAVKSS